MSRKALLTTLAVAILVTGVWLFGRLLWQAVLRLHAH